MIYKNSSRTQKGRSQKVDKTSFQRPNTEELCPVIESRSAQVKLLQEVSMEQVNVPNVECHNQSETLNKSAASAATEENKRPIVSKPAIPPKPKHLKKKQRDSQSSDTKEFESNQTDILRSETKLQSQEKTVGKDEDVSTKNQPNKINATPKVITPEERNQAKDTMNETDESHVDFSEACQKFGGKKSSSIKNAPVKPKRVKLAHPDNKNPKDTIEANKSTILSHMDSKPQQTVTDPCHAGTQTVDGKDRHETGGQIKQESKVEMREKRARTETEDECRQRLSVHMDDIMRGNITAAMEIFDNLQKQEELQNILSRVEEIEQDTSEVDVRSMRRVFENVPEWVVTSNDKKQKKLEVEHREETSPLMDNPQSKSSMAHIFGDLERASEEIMNLKEQTLAKLIDIEEAIKKALCSVSTLKSDSDIAGLSCLFKESLGTMKEAPSSENISKISIGSCRTKSQESPTTKGNMARQGAATEVASAKQPPSPPSSPAFISIESGIKKMDKTDTAQPESAICPMCQHSPKTEEKFRTTKTLTCHSPAQKEGQKQSTYSPVHPKRECSVLEVQNDQEGNPIVGTKTVTQNYERSDHIGNRFYSSKTVVTTQPETMLTATSPTSVSAATHQVTTYPEVHLPVNRNTKMV
ncbi:xin actin-binding repeat-containing protein 1-like [Solea solea]|uniref:xin actin-binding repeat-containing protein 1-like n=1 Tax=Solea solea TaxID=90069 RepID=UPI00272A1ADD|nr:xin actin-binding repeat-containing protein 1-like [Solea solea]